MQNLPPELNGMKAMDPQAPKRFSPGMCYDLIHNGLGQRCGWGIFGGLSDDQTYGLWYVNLYSNREWFARSPPEIDWQRSPVPHLTNDIRNDVSFCSVADYERFMKLKVPKEIKDHFQRTLPVVPKPVLKCEHCNKVYVDQRSFLTHVGQCEEKKKLAAVKREKDIASRQADALPPCPHCNRVFTIRSYYDAHVRQCETKVHEKTEKVPLDPCPHCSRVFTVRRHYEAHITQCEAKMLAKDSQKASAETILPCPYCEKIFTYRKPQ